MLLWLQWWKQHLKADEPRRQTEAASAAAQRSLIGDVIVQAERISHAVYKAAQPEENRGAGLGSLQE